MRIKRDFCGVEVLLEHSCLRVYLLYDTGLFAADLLPQVHIESSNVTLKMLRGFLFVVVY